MCTTWSCMLCASVCAERVHGDVMKTRKMYLTCSSIRWKIIVAWNAFRFLVGFCRSRRHMRTRAATMRARHPTGAGPSSHLWSHNCFRFNTAKLLGKPLLFIVSIRRGRELFHLSRFCAVARPARLSPGMAVVRVENRSVPHDQEHLLGFNYFSQDKTGHEHRNNRPTELRRPPRMRRHKPANAIIHRNSKFTGKI